MTGGMIGVSPDASRRRRLRETAQTATFRFDMSAYLIIALVAFKMTLGMGRRRKRVGIDFQNPQGLLSLSPAGWIGCLPLGFLPRNSG